MSNSNRKGQPARSGKQASPFADRRVIILIVLVVAAIAYFVYGWWSDRAEREIARNKLVTVLSEELEKREPSADDLSTLMAGILKLPDAATASDLLALQARVALVRGRPERAEDLFGAIAANPSATAEERSLGARILLALHAGFGGDIVEAKTMLEQAMAMAESAYAQTKDVHDLFCAWQAASRLWDPRARELADQLKANHAASPESQVVQIRKDFDPVRDGQAVMNLDRELRSSPAELRAMQTIATVADNDVPAALKNAEQHLLLAPGAPCVRIALAYVLHVCASGHPEGSEDRAGFAARRDQQLDWLDKRAPDEERAKWAPMRQLR